MQKMLYIYHFRPLTNVSTEKSNSVKCLKSLVPKIIKLKKPEVIAPAIGNNYSHKMFSEG